MVDNVRLMVTLSSIKWHLLEDPLEDRTLPYFHSSNTHGPRLLIRRATPLISHLALIVRPVAYPPHLSESNTPINLPPSVSECLYPLPDTIIILDFNDT